MKRKRFSVIFNFILVLLLVFFLNFVTATEILDELHLNIQTTDIDGNLVTGTFSFVFNISTSDTCNPVVYSNSTSLTTDSRGIISYYLENTGLSYDEQYYLCYYREGSLIETSKIARTPYSFTTRNVTLSGVTMDSNLELGGYNATASYFFGDGSGLTNINISAIDMSEYVPYTGAISNLDLGAHNFSVGSTNFFVNSDTGNVGIGTTTPQNTFNVVGDGNFTGSLYSNGAAVLTSATLDESDPMWTGNKTLVAFLASANTFTANNLFNGNLTVSTNKFFVNSNTGNVGIGTTNPSQTLDINGSLSIKSLSILVGGEGNVNVY